MSFPVSHIVPGTIMVRNYIWHMQWTNKIDRYVYLGFHTGRSLIRIGLAIFGVESRAQSLQNLTWCSASLVIFGPHTFDRSRIFVATVPGWLSWSAASTGRRSIECNSAYFHIIVYYLGNNFAFTRTLLCKNFVYFYFLTFTLIHICSVMSVNSLHLEM